MEIQVPWHDDYDLGEGIDALSGKPRTSALESITYLPPTKEGHRRESGSNIIYNLDEQRSDTGVNMSATINLGQPATVGAKFNYKHLSAFSSSSIMVEHWIDGKYDFEHVALHDLKLTPAAKEDSKDPHIFRERYGDYFIYGFQRCYAFRAIVRCK